MSVVVRPARRIPTVLLSVGVVAAVVASMMIVGGAGSPAVAFQQTGHWVFNRADSAVVHVDSGTRQVDARVKVPDAGPAPLFTLQGDRQGFIVGRRSITVFGKSTLTVDATVPTGQSELPIGIEVVGGPYLIYRQAGTIVRLGVPPLSIPIGGPVERPVHTDDGTVWMRRIDDGDLCALRRGANQLDCSLQTVPGTPGALTVASSTAAFVDTGQDALESIGATALSAPVSVGTDLQDEALIGDRDTRGRLPAVVTTPNRLVLADTSGVPALRPGGSPITADLGDGQFTSPVAADGVVAVIEQVHNRLLTFAVDGRALDAVDLPPGEGPASITRGEDGRVYVDDADGSVTHVVGADGKATPIRTGGAAAVAVAAPPPDQVSLIRPPRRGPTPPSTGRDRPVQGPGEVPVKLPDTPSDPGTDPVDTLPTAPNGVEAVARPDGSVAVSWDAVPGAEMRYSVLVDGGPTARSTGTTSTLAGLTAGRRYGITVSATNGVGAGPASPAVTVTPFGAAGAPRNAEIAIHNAGDNTQVSLFWDAPDLGGGELVGYRVTGPGGQAGPVDEMVTQQGTMQLQFNQITTYCSPTIRFEVRAITTPPGGGRQMSGPSAAVSRPSPWDCTPKLTLISATASGPDSAFINFQCYNNSGGGGAIGGDFVLTADGGGTANPASANGGCMTGQKQAYSTSLTGLSPSTTYTLTGTISAGYGVKPATNSVTFITRAN